MHKLIQIFFLSLAIIGLKSCERGVVYSEFVTFQEQGWHQTEPAEFVVDVADTIAFYNVELFINTYKEYPYRNLYLFLETIYPNGTMSRDTLEFLFQTEAGRYLGKCNNTSCRNEYLFRQNLRFEHTGPHILRFIQAMRSSDGNLPYIRQFGIKIKRAQS